MKKLMMLALVFTLSGVEGLSAETFDIDPMHTTVGFKIKHLGLNNVNGHFNSFTGTVDYDEKAPEKSKVQATISAASVDTGISKRDDHLRNPDFFDVSKYPTIAFKSTGVEKGKDGGLKLKGNLTLHGVTKPLVLDLEVNGIVDHPQAGRKAGFTATGKLDRTQFGVGQDGGGLSNDVMIALDIQGNARAAKDKETKKK